jgi:hypothetical protein
VRRPRRAIREVPSDPDQAFELSRRLYGEKLGFAVFARTPFEDANAVGSSRRAPRRSATEEDLRPRRPERAAVARRLGRVFRRPDCAKGLEEVYGLRFPPQDPIDLAPAPRGRRGAVAPT